MKHLTGKSLLLILIPLLLFALYGCQDDSNNTIGAVDMSDDELIEAIENATDLEEINYTQLPASSQSVIEENYYDHIVISVNRALNLGYLVSLGDVGERLGEGEQVYFGLQGRRLVRDGNDNGGRNGEGGGRGGDERDRWLCFHLVFPVTFIMPDGTEITVESADGLSAIRQWYLDNPDYHEPPSFAYPIQVILPDGTILTINSDEELRRLFAQRERRGGRNPEEACFEFVYPITYLMPDSSEIIVESEDGMVAIREWYQDHPGVRIRPRLQYPVDIEFIEDGAIVTINNDRQLRRAYASCGDDEGPGRDPGDACFEFVYPITYIMPDSSEIIVESEEGMIALREWYADHPRVRIRPRLQYPVDIEFFEDGNIVTINNDRQLRRAYASCE